MTGAGKGARRSGRWQGWPRALPEGRDRIAGPLALRTRKPTLSEAQDVPCHSGSGGPNGQRPPGRHFCAGAQRSCGVLTVTASPPPVVV